MECPNGENSVGSCSLDLDPRVVDFQLVGVGLRPLSFKVGEVRLKVIQGGSHRF